MSVGGVCRLSIQLKVIFTRCAVKVTSCLSENVLEGDSLPHLRRCLSAAELDAHDDGRQVGGDEDRESDSHGAQRGNVTPGPPLSAREAADRRREAWPRPSQRVPTNPSESHTCARIRVAEWLRRGLAEGVRIAISLQIAGGR